MEIYVESYTGTMVDGKFQKDTSDEAKANWYKADFSKAKIRDGEHCE